MSVGLRWRVILALSLTAAKLGSASAQRQPGKEVRGESRHLYARLSTLDSCRIRSLSHPLVLSASYCIHFLSHPLLVASTSYIHFLSHPLPVLFASHRIRFLLTPASYRIRFLFHPLLIASADWVVYELSSGGGRGDAVTRLSADLADSLTSPDPAPRLPTFTLCVWFRVTTFLERSTILSYALSDTMDDAVRIREFRSSFSLGGMKGTGCVSLGSIKYILGFGDEDEINKV